MQLHLRVVEAVDVPKMDVDSSDPYCIIEVPQVNRKEKTTVINNSLTPRWNQEFHIPLNDPAQATLNITMKDKDVTKDDKISSLTIPLCSIPVRTVIDQWYNMVPKGKKKGGRLHLVIHIAPTGEQPFVQLMIPGAGSQPGYIPGCAPGMYPPGQYPPPYAQIPPQGQVPPQQQYPPYQGAPPPQQYPTYPGAPPQQQYQPYPGAPPQQQTPAYPGAPMPQQPTQPAPPAQTILPPAPQPVQPAQPEPQPAKPAPKPEKPHDKPHHQQIDPPPRPPGMKDEVYRKLFQAQKRLLKMAMGGPGVRIVIRL